VKSIMGLTFVAVAVALGAGVAPASAAEFGANEAHQKFVEAFNNRQWDEVRSLVAEKSAFHRANADEVFVGPDAIVEVFEKTVGAPDQWNVKFVRLETEDHVTGKDGGVVERGDFAVTAGPKDDSCYVGHYMITWLPEGDNWQLQALAWQDVEMPIAECQ
jgi:hypothetical protein